MRSREPSFGAGDEGVPDDARPAQRAQQRDLHDPPHARRGAPGGASASAMDALADAAADELAGRGGGAAHVRI